MAERFPPYQYAQDKKPPDSIMGYVAVTATASVAGGGPLPPLEEFRSTAADRAAARAGLERTGLTVTAESEFGFAVAGPAGAYEQLTGGAVRAIERFMHAEMGRRRYVTHFDIEGAGSDELGVGLVDSDAIDAVMLERPRIALARPPSPLPPAVSKFHLRVPDDVAMLLNALEAHRNKQMGDGVRIAMIDSGHYAHPFFRTHGYRVQDAQTAVPKTDPAEDPSGHGTGESANVFALAPAAILEPYRASDGNGHLVGALTAFMQAKATDPDVLTCSWGGDADYPPPDDDELRVYARALAAEVRDAVERRNIVVVFAAGNGNFSIEAQVPQVISAGGAYVSENGELWASDYASGYESPYFEGRHVPDLCGLVGLDPRAQYLMLPVPPGSGVDVEESMAADGDTSDGTASDDGWALFSGTSAAAPQIAGAAALIRGARPDLTPGDVRHAMMATAFDVTRGRNDERFDEPAGAGIDVATGAGLLNASAAVAWARERPSQ